MINEQKIMTLSKITNDHLDELVCGDVPPKRYREILTRLDAEPEKWRDCALAFLQEQAIEAEMRKLAIGDANWDGTTEAKTKVEPNTSVIQGVRRALPSGQSETERLHQLQRWTSIAASVLIAFTVGWVGSGFMGQSSVEPGVAIQQAGGSENLQLTESSPRTESLPDLNQDWNQGPTFASNESLVLDNEIPDELVKLQRLGYQIESTSRLVPVELSNGKSAIVPIKTYRALPPALPY